MPSWWYSERTGDTEVTQVRLGERRRNGAAHASSYRVKLRRRRSLLGSHSPLVAGIAIGVIGIAAALWGVSYLLSE